MRHFFSAVLLTLTAALAQAQSAEWPAYGGDPGGARWSPLTDVTRVNVAGHRIAWTYLTGEIPPANRRVSFEATPIVVEGSMFFSTPRGKIIALDPETGAERWKFDAKVDSTLRFGDYTSRGVSFWRDTGAPRNATCAARVIVATVDARLFQRTDTNRHHEPTPRPGYKNPVHTLSANGTLSRIDGPSRS